MSTKSPRVWAASVLAALALIAGACSNGGAINDLVGDQVQESSEVEETSDEVTEEVPVDEPVEEEAEVEEVEEKVEEEVAEPEEESEVLGETEDAAEEEVEDDAADSDADATTEEGQSLDDAIGDLGLSEEDSLTLGTDLGEPEPADGDDTDDAESDGDDETDSEDTDEETDSEETAAATQFAIVGVDVGLNLRTGPGGEFLVIFGIEKDRVVTGTGNVDGGWTEVQIDGFTGWVLGEFLVEIDTVAAPAVTETTTPVAAPTSFTVVNVDAGVNIRSGPGVDNPVVGGAALGDSVTATGNVSGTWTEVEHNGITGWASTDRLAAN